MIRYKPRIIMARTHGMDYIVDKLDLHSDRVKVVDTLIKLFHVYLTEFYVQKITFLCYETNH